MTACAIETAAEDGALRRTGFAITADGTYAARLTLGSGSRGASGGRSERGGGDGNGGRREHGTGGGSGTRQGNGGGGGSGSGTQQENGTGSGSGSGTQQGNGDGVGGGGGDGGGGGYGHGDAWFPERWTLDGPEPYAVPLPLDQPEEPDSDVLPLTDGRVLIRRRVADRHDFSLLYPTGPGTGQLPLGAVGCDRLALLPPSPDGRSVLALAVGEHSTTVWLVAGGAFGPERVAEVAGRCSGGVWLDRTGRILALDRERDGVVKAVAVDLGRGGEVTPLLQITEESNDRLLLADPDSGLLLIRSDAPGHDRLGWGVVGSLRPVRFPECLRLADSMVTPFAVQPGQVLMPESCAVALRIEGAAGSGLGIWRPTGRQLHRLAPPQGWLAGAGLWTREGVLRLPYATREVPCGVARLAAPAEPAGAAVRWESAAPTASAPRLRRTPPAGAATPPGSPAPMGAGLTAVTATAAASATSATSATEFTQAESPGGEPFTPPPTPLLCRPVPLQQAPLTGRGVPG
ncbi:hypothetical protein ACFYYH_25185 [Streptomyces sp. NPDC002018]|uniref:hypothetical protein n=1 Tax=Streptomyces sp. NPDC002018 TaxID=3364629 RepID=UPI00369AAADF